MTDIKNKMTEIVVYGSCMIDLICYAEKLPKPGETLHGTDFKMGNGGKGANQCVAAAKLGASTALIARLGNDSFGLAYKEHLELLGVNTDHVTLTDGISSGMAQITVSEEGENVIVIVAGANNKLSLNDAQVAEDLLRSSKVVIFQFEVPVKSTIETLEFIKRQKGPYTIVNGAPAIKDVDPRIYELCDIFCVNETEAEELTGMKVTSINDAFHVAKKFKSYGCKSVIITLGKEGAVFAEGDNVPHHVQTTDNVTPVDTTGAGDAFIGALAFFLAYCPKADLYSCVSRACQIASYSVQEKGTQDSFPSREDLSPDLFADVN